MTPILAGPDDAPRLVESLRGARRIAVDTEFHAERRFVPELYLVQIHVDAGDGAGPTWIVDPLHGDLVARIAAAMLEVPWVVHGGEQDLRVLFIALGGLPERIDDTQIAAGLQSDHWPAPYGGLIAEHLGTAIEKGETLSDWSRRPLSASQIAYAALDVQLLLPLWDRLAEGLERRGRTGIARRACDDARKAAVDPPDDGDAFRSLPVVSTLPPAQLLVLQELAAWRMERGRATNQPIRTVMSDGVLVDLARRQPPTAGALMANRRLPRNLAREAEELVERIARARARPDWAIPRVVRRRTVEWRAAEWLQLWAESEGSEHHFAANLALPRAVVERLVLEPAADRSRIAEILGWRDELLGDGLALALAGGVALRLVARAVVREVGPSGDWSAIPVLEKIS